MTRRVTQRCYLLRPDETTNEILDYCLAEAAARFEIKIITWKILSNHYHLVYHDPHGKAPAFAEHFHKMVAKVMNKYLGRSENFWSSDPTCITHLPTLQDVFDKVVYTLSNSVAAHLVDKASEWPGSHSYDYLDGKETVHERPKYFFKANSKRMPERATLSVKPPPGAWDTWADDVRKAVAEREKKARAERRTKGIKVLGVAGVLKMPRSSSPKAAAKQSKLRPALACKDPVRRAYELKALKEFRIAYAIARVAFRKGDRKVLFPKGTYKMSLLVGVRVDGDGVRRGAKAATRASPRGRPQVVRRKVEARPVAGTRSVRSSSPT